MNQEMSPARDSPVHQLCLMKERDKLGDRLEDGVEDEVQKVNWEVSMGIRG